MISVEPKNIYKKDLADFNANIRYMNGTVFWREEKDDNGKLTGKVFIKIAAQHKFPDGETTTQKVKKLKD